MPRDEYKPSFYPPMPHGPGYLLNSDAARKISELFEAGEVKALRLEVLVLLHCAGELECSIWQDVSMALWVDHLKQKLGWKVVYRHNEKFRGSAACRADNFITHYIRPGRMQCMWQEEAEQSRKMCKCK